MEEVDDEVITQCRIFIDNFNKGSIDEDYLESREAPKFVTDDDLNAEILDWVFGYLKSVNCPLNLSAVVARNVQLDFKSVNLEDLVCDRDSQPGALGYDRIRLWKVVVNRMRDTFQRLTHVPDYELRGLLPSNNKELSVCAIKNGRRVMEDRHVVVPDVNALFGIVDGHEPTSFYAIFDGHAGTEAACYASVHLHYNIINHPSYPDDIETALKEGIKKTDGNFIEKCNRENLKSGSTALCCLQQGRKLYVAWLGDSQAVLVRAGSPVSIMVPHKPDRQDERDRIEKLGGIVVHFGTWRVNGTLAVSRAIGDAEYKPYVSGDPDVVSLDLDGTEDFIILACDGLWDVLHPKDVAELVYSHIAEDIDDVNAVAAKLIQVAKIKGSSDNITVIIVFLRRVKDVYSCIPLYKSTDTAAKTSLPLNGNPFLIEDSPTADSKITYSRIEDNSQTQNIGFDQSKTFIQSEVSGFMVGAGDHIQTAKVFDNFTSEWDDSGLKFQQQHFLERESQVEANPFYEGNLRNFTVPGSTEENYFGYMEQRTVVQESSAAFSAVVGADWSDRIPGVGGDHLDMDSRVNKAFDEIKPFHSNLSPDAKPFVMPDTVPSSVKHAMYYENTASTDSSNRAESLITDEFSYGSDNNMQYSYPLPTSDSNVAFVADLNNDTIDTRAESGYATGETIELNSNVATTLSPESEQVIEEPWGGTVQSQDFLKSDVESVAFQRESVGVDSVTLDLGANIHDKFSPEKPFIGNDVDLEVKTESESRTLAADDFLINLTYDKSDTCGVIELEKIDVGESSNYDSTDKAPVTGYFSDTTNAEISSELIEGTVRSPGFISEKSDLIADHDLEDSKRIEENLIETTSDESLEFSSSAMENLHQESDVNNVAEDERAIEITTNVSGLVKTIENVEGVPYDEVIVKSFNEEPIHEGIADVKDTEFVSQDIGFNEEAVSKISDEITFSYDVGVTSPVRDVLTPHDGDVGSPTRDAVTPHEDNVVSPVHDVTKDGIQSPLTAAPHDDVSPVGDVTPHDDDVLSPVRDVTPHDDDVSPVGDVVTPHDVVSPVRDVTPHDDDVSPVRDVTHNVSSPVKDVVALHDDDVLSPVRDVVAPHDDFLSPVAHDDDVGCPVRDVTPADNDGSPARDTVTPHVSTFQDVVTTPDSVQSPVSVAAHDDGVVSPVNEVGTPHDYVIPSFRDELGNRIDGDVLPVGDEVEAQNKIEIVDHGTMENGGSPQDVGIAVQQGIDEQNEIIEVNQEGCGTTESERLTYVETIISDVKFNKSTDVLGQLAAEGLDDILKSVDKKSDVPLVSSLDDESKEPQLATSLTVEKIPDGVLMAEGVEDDESEDGEEWKFYRTEGTELKQSTSVAGDVPVEDVARDTKEDEPLQSSSSVLESNLSLGESGIRPLDSSTEAPPTLHDISITDKLEVESPSVAPVKAEAQKKPKTKDAVKLKSTTTKAALQPTAPPAQPKSSVASKRASSGAPSTQKTAVVSTKTTISKSADATKKPQAKLATTRSGASAGVRTGVSKTNGESTKTEVETKKTVTSSRPKLSAKTEQSKAQVRTSLTSSTITSSTISASSISTTATTTTIATTVASKKTVAASGKTSKEQLNVRSKVVPVSVGITNGQTKLVKTKTVPHSIEKKSTVNVVSTTTSASTTRSVAKSSSGLKRDPVKSAVSGTTTVQKVDAKQLKETVNKQISGTARKVVTSVATKSTTSKLEVNGSSKTTPKTTVVVARNGITPEKKTPTTHRSTPQTSTPKSKTSTPKPSVTSAKVTMSATSSSRTTSVSRTSSTPTAMLKSTKSPLLSKGKTPPLKSSGKTPSGTSKVDKAKADSPKVKNGLTDVKVEEGTKEKGILDAASRESAPVSSLNEAGVESKLQMELVAASDTNGVEKLQIESPQIESDGQILNGQTLESHQTEEGILLV